METIVLWSKILTSESNQIIIWIANSSLFYILKLRLSNYNPNNQKYSAYK